MGLAHRTMQETLQTLVRVVYDLSDLAHWAVSVETTAKSMNDDKSDNITFEYFSDEKIMKFFVKMLNQETI